MLNERPDGTWWLDFPLPCVPDHHLLDRGPLSVLIESVAEYDPLRDRLILLWADLGNRSAWWCYACGAWGVGTLGRPVFEGRRSQPSRSGIKGKGRGRRR